MATVSASSLLLMQDSHAQSSVYGGKPAEISRADNGALINDELNQNPFMHSDPQLTQLNERVWVAHGYALANSSFVVTDEGVVVFDTGDNVGQGKYFLSQIRSVTDKPIIAIIYSHSHYVGGAAVFAEGSPEKVRVIAHPNLGKGNAGELALLPARSRRANMQFGAYLPEEGDDARATTPEPHFDEPENQAFAPLPVSHRVSDGEEVEIGGLTFQFFWTPADTLDSLSVWIPALQTVLTNTVSNMYYPIYTLRGERYRDPNDIITSYDRLRALPVEHYAPVHGRPISGHDAVYQTLTNQRDAYSYTYNQTVRGINRGMTPDELAWTVKLPPHLAGTEGLYEVYSEVSYAVRGIYRGLVGWFDEDTTELNPPAASALGQSIVEGFGGIDALLKAAGNAQAENRYNLAAKLARFAVDAEPSHEGARQALATALRSMAQVSISLQSHNFYLTEALDLEGTIDRMAAPETPVFPDRSALVLSRLPLLPLARILEARINPEKTVDVDAVYRLDVTGTDAPVYVHIRRGVAEVTPTHEQAADEVITISRDELNSFLAGPASPETCEAGLPSACAFLDLFR